MKGGITVFVLDRHYDYAEFGKMVESRTIPQGVEGHWRRAGIDAYAAVTLGSETSAAPLLIIEQVAALATAGIGDVPDWFAAGTGRAIVSRLDAKSDRVVEWRGAAKRMGRIKPQEFFDGRLPPEPTALASYVFVDRLMKSVKSYRTLIREVRGGKGFDQAFMEAYKISPAAAFNAALR